MAVLRHVPKTFSFEEQRIEINEIAQDLYDLNVTASGIALTDISVVKPNPTASGSGDVTYDSSNGQFTYTPPELNFLTDLGDAIVDGDFTTGGLMKTDGAGNYSVITDNSTDWDEAHGWGDHANAGYLTGLPAHSHSLVSLSDTSLTGGDAPSDGEALVWDQTNTTWKAGTISSGWQGNVQNSTTANGGGAISFDANTNTLIFQPTEFNYDGTGVAQGKTLRYNGTKWVISQDVSYSQAILGDFSSVQWDLTPTIDGGAGIADSITITAGDNITFSSVSGSGFTIDAEDGVVNINDLGDVDTTGAVNGKILKHNGTKFVIADDAGGTITSLNDIGDVNVGTTITDGHVLKWDLATTKWIAGPDLTSSGGSGIALTDISVVKPNPTPSGSGDVTYNSTSGQFTYTPPSIPAAQVKSDWDSTTGLSEILNKPTIVENLNDLGDVDTTGAANGKILKYNGTSWEIADDLTSGGGSASFTGLSDTPNSLSAGKWLKVNAGGTSLEWTDEPTGGDTYSIEALASPGIQLLDNGNAGASNRVFFDGLGAISLARKTGTTNTIEFSASTFTGTSVGLVPASTSGVTDKFLKSDGTWDDPPTGGTTDLSNYVKKSDTTHTTVSRTGANSYFIINTESYFQCNPDAQCTFDVGGQFAVDAVGQIQLHSDQYVETRSTYVIFKSVDGQTDYARIYGNGNLEIQGGLIDKDGGIGAAGEILSSTGSRLEWITAPGEANVQVDWTQTTTTAADYIKNKPGAFGGTASGLVPASTSGETSKFLRSDGTWQDVSSGATTIDGLTDTNLNTSNLGSGQVLQHDGSKWVNADAPGGVPSGTIVMFNSATAPSGWALCDGNNNTPDLRDKFIVGAGNSYNQGSTGGSKDAVVISHSHGAGNLGTSNTGSHSHTSGNFGTNNTGSHSHNQSGSGSGSGTTGNQSANHYHTTSTTVNTGSDGSHQHRWGTNDNIGATGGNQNPDAAGGSDWRAWTDSQGAHSHTFNFTHDTLGVSENHTHDFNFNYNIGGSTGNDGSHSHNVSGNTNNTGSHSHNVTGNTSSEGSGGSDKNLPPYYALTYIMKL